MVLPKTSHMHQKHQNQWTQCKLVGLLGVNIKCSSVILYSRAPWSAIDMDIGDKCQCRSSSGLTHWYWSTWTSLNLTWKLINLKNGMQMRLVTFLFWRFFFKQLHWKLTCPNAAPQIRLFWEAAYFFKGMNETELGMPWSRGFEPLEWKQAMGFLCLQRPWPPPKTGTKPLPLQQLPTCGVVRNDSPIKMALNLA